jgi:type I restriction enzyme, S subunit
MKTVMNKPGYKHTPLGWIPEDWEVKTVGEAYTISNNLRFPISEEIRKTIKGRYPYYGPTKIQDFINEYRVEGKYALIGEDGDHFLKWRELPMTLLVEGKFNVNNHAHLIKGEKNLIEWFFYFFNHRELTPYLTRQGAGRYKLTKESLVKIPVSIPPLPEQRCIATLLSTWDAAIAKEQQLIDALQTRHHTLMQQLLSGKKRLKGFKREWKKMSYGNLLKEVKRAVIWSDDELYQLISVRRRSGGIFSREALYGYQIKVKDLRTANAGDFLFSKMQIVHGASALVTQDFHGTKISGSYIAVIAKNPEKLDMQFFNWYSQQPYFYHQTYVSSFGVHIEKMTFDFEAFLSLEMTLPPLSEQTAIANILSTSEKEIQTHRRRLAALRQQKKGLMQVLLTGKVRVKVDANKKL